MIDLATQSFKISRELSQCANTDDLADLFQKSIALVSLSCSACGMVTGPMAVSRTPFFFAKWPAGWSELYVKEGFVDSDPCPRYALSSGKAATWTEIMAKLPKGDPGQAIFTAANAWGFTEGLVVPLRNGRGDLGLMSMGGKRPALNAEETDFLKIISVTAFERANALTPESALDPLTATFTARESVSINLLHQGLTDQEIANAMGVSIVTVRSHIENARRKVSARSRTHLAALTVPIFGAPRVSGAQP